MRAALCALALLSDGCSPDPGRGRPSSGPGEDPRVAIAKAQAEAISAALESYVNSIGRYPASLGELTQPHGGRPGPLAPVALIDPWGRPFRYDRSGANNAGKRPDVWTLTPDGAAAGNW